MDVNYFIEHFTQKYFKSKITNKSIGDIALGRNYTFDLIDTPYILKLFGDNQKWSREVASLTFLYYKKLKTPSIIDYGIFEEEYYWLLMTKLQGVLFKDIAETLSVKDYNSLLYESGVYLGQFHRLTQMNIYGKWDEKQNIVKSFPTFYDFETEKNRRRANRTLDLYGVNHELFKKANEKMLALEYSIKDVHKYTLCHNDYCSRNILVSEKQGKWQIEGVIDFEASYPADPESDLTKMLFENYFYSDKNCFIEGYSSIKPLSENINTKIEYYLFSLCLDVCSWALEKSYDYFERAENILKKMLNLN